MMAVSEAQELRNEVVYKIEASFPTLSLTVFQRVSMVKVVSVVGRVACESE
jgi:hypothetical protein